MSNVTLIGNCFRVDPAAIAAVDLKAWQPYVAFQPEYAKFFVAEEGEHYKLLSSLASQCPPGSTIVDMGTLYGSSAVALASGAREGTRVITYDIVDHLPPLALSAKHLPMVERKIADGVASAASMLQAPLILCDVDPHDGKQEREFVEALVDKGYKGVVLFDDIHLNDEMKAFWEWVPLTKVDLTEVGHFSGTGAVVF